MSGDVAASSMRVGQLVHDGLPAAIEVWSFDLDDVAWDAALQTLAPDENRRAARFVHDLDAVRYRRAHVATRALLARASGVAPQALCFATGPHGKPFLVDAPGAADSAGTIDRRWPSFNLSHSAGRGLLVIGDGRDVGIDVEVLRPVEDLELLADSQLHPVESAAWRTLPASSRERAFLRAWTRKEAVVKAIGAGLSVVARDVEVGLGEVGPGEVRPGEAGPVGSPRTVDPRGWSDPVDADGRAAGPLTLISFHEDPTCLISVAFGAVAPT